MDKKLWDKLFRQNSLNEGRNDPNKPSEIDGKRKAQAIKMIYKKVYPYTKGIYRDEDWRNINKIWKEFDNMNLDWWIEEAKYGKNDEGVPVNKEWKFAIEYENERGKKQKFGGHVMAHGAGSVKDPLDRYDITVVLW